MITQEQIFFMHDMNPERKTVSISIINIFKNDSIEVGRSSPHTMAFAPGDIDKVKLFIGIDSCPEITYLDSIWTQDVINAYNQEMADYQSSLRQ